MRSGWAKLLMSRVVTRYWPWVIAAWSLVALALFLAAPRWDDITADGDLAYLPESVPSATGLKAIEKAFPGTNSRSQLVVVFAREREPLSRDDLALAMDFARRLHWMAGKAAWEAGAADSLREPFEVSPKAASGEPPDEQQPNPSSALDVKADAAEPTESEPTESEPTESEPTESATDESATDESATDESATDESATDESEPTEVVTDKEAPVAEEQLSVLAERARDNLTEAIELEQNLADYFAEVDPDVMLERLPAAYQLRGELLQQLGQTEDAAVDLSTAQLLREQQNSKLSPMLPDWAQAVRDVWSWRSPVVGHKLGSENAQARLVSIQLSSEFTATTNIGFVNGIEELARNLRSQYQNVSKDLRAEVAGSAAVGADMLRATQSGMRKTEVVTVVLVLIILASVYRSPLLVAIPLTSIGLSLFVATHVIALLARDPADSHGAGLGVFTTTRIFVVVLLFGAGTDFCLFFLARNRELLQARRVRTRKQMYRVVASSWRSVFGALVASATTTIVGLALMWFSGFQKFQFSGPVIAISLAITLMVCLTFTPALLSALGRLAFWPVHRFPAGRNGTEKPRTDLLTSRSKRYWATLAESIVGNPAIALSITIALLSIPATYGVMCMGRVTYDLTEELSESAPSRRGAELIGRFFPTRDASPITVLLTRDVPFASEDELREACGQLSTTLYAEGVDSVRSLTDPLGDYPPGKRMGLFAQDAWRRRVLLGHRITRERFVSSASELSRRVAKFDVVLHDNPFTLQASATLARLQEILHKETARADSPWSGAQIDLAGTTVGITDLRSVTQADQHRIQILVTLGVWLVLVLMLRKPLLSTYLILTVLLSYFATLGITYWTFAQLYGQDYGGLDWKVPLFLFVILVAVGQDYNVYLVTRIFEERRTAGWNQAVRRALEMTGGIITSCGLVMAGTFIAMTSPALLHWLGGILQVAWLPTDAPVLRGVTELGFALAFGVMLDTLVVRSILVPSFVILVNRPSQFSRIRKPALLGG